MLRADKHAPRNFNPHSKRLQLGRIADEVMFVAEQFDVHALKLGGNFSPAADKLLKAAELIQQVRDGLYD